MQWSPNNKNKQQHDFNCSSVYHVHWASSRKLPVPASSALSWCRILVLTKGLVSICHMDSLTWLMACKGLPTLHTSTPLEAPRIYQGGPWTIMPYIHSTIPPTVSVLPSTQPNTHFPLQFATLPPKYHLFNNTMSTKYQCPSIEPIINFHIIQKQIWDSSYLQSCHCCLHLPHQDSGQHLHHHIPSNQNLWTQ